MTLYGLGVTIGAGIFALVGKVAERAGLYAPTSFLLAAVLAAFTAFSFAEMAARFPRSAGEAVYVHEGLRLKTLPLIVGFLVTAAGCISAAAIVNGAIGYLNEFFAAPRPLVVVAIVAALAALAAWGITESVFVASLFTVVEIAALGVVVGAGFVGVEDFGAHLPMLVPPLEAAAGWGIVAGALLAFYAFIGFEDMVNVAEEVHDVTRVLPAAIVLTLVITTVLYFLIALASVLAVPPAELAASGAPLALIFERSTGLSPAAISLIAIFAILNGALIQTIMAARVLYGLSAEGWLPGALRRVHARTRTPLVATAVVATVVLVCALALPIETLAEMTSVITLVIFSLVNLALWRLKRRAPRPPGVRVYPVWVPIVGFAVSSGFVLLEIARLLRGIGG